MVAFFRMITLLGLKYTQSQGFLTDGRRIPVTEVLVPGNPVISIKSKDKAGYDAVQLGIGVRKHANKSLQGHIKGAKLETAPRFLREVRIVDTDMAMPTVGDVVKALDVFKPGDIVDVTGVSKGKGFAGGVKRYGFKGGPRTHGQSDRERAPGSIGQTTTPGRVYKGKRMAGNMGRDTVTMKNLMIVDVLEDRVLIKGLVPGIRNSLLLITKKGENKKFVPLYKEEIKTEATTEPEEIQNDTAEKIIEQKEVKEAEHAS